MFIVSFFSWWYGDGWKGVLASFGPRLQNLANTFSVKQLLQTLFAPWRRIISYPGASLDAKMRALADNLFSRIIGFIVRIMVILAAFLTLLVVTLATVIELIVWPLLPFAIPAGIILGIAL